MSKKDKRVDLDTRPYIQFKNYDYGNCEPTEISPGGGPWNGTPGGGEKSLKDFIDKRRKQNKKLKRLSYLINIYYNKANSF